MVNKEADHLLAKELVIQSLKLLGVRSGTTANCKVLSREMERTIGKKLSAITLFRMLYPEKYGVKPYRYSLDMLVEFIETMEQRKVATEAIQWDNPLLSRNEPAETALYKLLRRNLESSQTNLLLEFLEDLPMDHLALGWERHVIGKALGDFVVKERRSSTEGSTYKAILGMPQTRTYYFETYLDFNRGLSVFGYSLERMLEEKGVRNKRTLPNLLSSSDEQWIVSCLFAYLMLHYFSWLSEDVERQRYYRKLLQSPSIVEFMEFHSRAFPFVRFRYEAFKLIEKQGRSGKTSAWEAQEWLSDLSQLFIGEKPWEKEFAFVMVADALVIISDRNGLERLVGGLTAKPIFEPVIQPVYIRAQLYRELISGASDERLKEVFYTNYQLGEGETAYHFLVMDRAMELFGRTLLSQEERNGWIAQTGFTLFSGGGEETNNSN